MDAFRRFRSRRKSKGQADGFTTFADAESNYRSDTSTRRPATTRSSATASRPSDATAEKKLSHDQFRQPKSPTDRPPGSAGRVQPMLIGISRPFASDSRPGTAESMQKALDRAAEAVSRTPQQSSFPLSPSSPFGLKAGKHVDIFAISTQAAKPSATFNEDVAERNLDQGTASGDDQHGRYQPNSKYQEEVANRNAHQIAAQRGSSLRGSIDIDPSKTSNGRTSAQSGSYQHQTHQSSEASRSRHVQDHSAYHSRQNSSRARDELDYLPAIPQERSSEDFSQTIKKNIGRVRQAEQELDEAQARWLEVRKQNHRGGSSNTDKPLPASPQQYPPRDTGLPTAGASDTRRSEVSTVPKNGLTRYDSADYGQTASTRSSTYVVHHDTPPNTHRGSNARTAPRRSSRVSEGSKKSDRLHPPSGASGTAYKRTIVGNRTIMDLTGEDDVEVLSLDRAVSVGSYMNTPVIEDARANAFQRAIPTVVDHTLNEHTTRESTFSNPRWSSALEPVLDLDQLARRSQIIPTTARALVREDLPKPPPAPPAPPVQASPVQTSPVQAPRLTQTPSQSGLAFSRIQTLTSSSPPRIITFSGVRTLTSISPCSSEENLVARTEEPAAPQAEIGTMTTLREGGDLDEPATREPKPRSNARISANIAPLVKIFADDSEAAKSSASSKPKVVRTDVDKAKTKESARSSSRKDGKYRERIAEAEAIREAAKSKIPAGPLDQEPHPGVKSRDFAIVPAEKPTNKRVEALAERKRSQIDLQKSSKEQPTVSKSSSSGERKSRSRSSKTTNKVDTAEKSASLPPPTARRSDKKGEKKSNNGKKSAKQSSSSTRKSKRKSLFDEEAFQRKHAEANAALLRLQQSLQETLEDESAGSATSTNAATPMSRAVSSASNVPNATSPSVAAMAMIAAATASPRSRSRPSLQAKASSDFGQKPSSRKPEPPLRSITENATPTMQNKTLVPMNPMLAKLDLNNRPPPSPGEVSLSSFPIPTPRAISPESTKSPPAYVRDIGMPVRRGSQASRVSTTSVFSIPFTMVPSRMASLPENRMGVPGASVTSQMTSIDSVIPPTQRSEATLS